VEWKLYSTFFILGDYPASEFYMPTSRNTVFSIFEGGVVSSCLHRLRRWKTRCSETSAYKIQTSGNGLKESIENFKHGESFKSRKIVSCYKVLPVSTLNYLSSWNVILEVSVCVLGRFQEVFKITMYKY